MRYILTILAAAIVFGVAHAAPRFRLVSEEEHAACMKLLPRTTDSWFEALKRRDDLIWYNERVMPPAYQFQGGAHDPRYNISAVKPQELLGNPNREFPWRTTAGLDGCENAGSYKFVCFPPGLAMRAWRESRPGTDGPVLVWSYPVGTVFGEVLTVRDADGYDYAFEVRTRERLDQLWQSRVYRPFPTPADLARALERLPRRTERGRRLAAHLHRPLRGAAVLVLDDSAHPARQAISVEAVEDVLPSLDAASVRELLTQTPFQKVSGPWRETSAGVCHAPTTDAAFHIVPQGYTGGFFKVSNKSCMTCHETTLCHADEFHPNLGAGTPGSRDWYGHVRGSDGIFSFHPFDPACISGNGFTTPIRLNPELITAGLVRE